MKIPIQNIYYLLCYAWDKLEEREVVHVDITDKDDVEDLLAKVLCSGISHLLKRGLDRGYVAHSEEMSTIRGRIVFAETLKRTFLREPRAFCEFDEFSHDVLHNRILRSTLRLLLTVQHLDPGVRDEVKGMYRLLEGVTEIRLSKKHFGMVKLSRNNHYYDFLLRVCEHIFDNVLPSDGDGKSKFRDFLRDEEAMARLFEAFVKNFYRRHATGWKVGGEKIKWDAEDVGDEALQVLPQMNTDISLTSRDRKIIIDTKYYKEAMTYHHRDGEKKARSGHLYQLYAYITNSIFDIAGAKCEGMLLYPAVDCDYRYDYRIKGHKVSIRTVNLNQEWRGIHAELMAIIA